MDAGEDVREEPGEREGVRERECERRVKARRTGLRVTPRRRALRVRGEGERDCGGDDDVSLRLACARGFGSLSV